MCPPCVVLEADKTTLSTFCRELVIRNLHSTFVALTLCLGIVTTFLGPGFHCLSFIPFYLLRLLQTGLMLSQDNAVFVDTSNAEPHITEKNYGEPKQKSLTQHQLGHSYKTSSNSL
jgi:hypothetical protein